MVELETQAELTPQNEEAIWQQNKTILSTEVREGKASSRHCAIDIVTSAKKKRLSV